MATDRAPPNPPSIGVDSFTGGGVILPVSAAAGGLGNIRANAKHPQILKQLVAMIALVRHHLPNPIGLGFYLLDVFGRRDHRFFNRFSVAFIGWLNCDSDHSARLKIYRMLGFMSQMRAAIFHFGNACIGIVGMGPVVIGSFLGASKRARSSRVGVSMPDAFASPMRNVS